MLPPLKIGGSEIFEQKNFYNTIGALLVVVTMINGLGRSVLEARVVQFLGVISYPLYLIHFMVLSSAACALYLRLPRSTPSLAAIFGIYMAICILAASLFEKYVDKPSISAANVVSSKLMQSKA